ncbi:hypothetical protein BC939DRAFT_252736 [Gamsiella multidivaricata]|uniref:uncharacterized protein n=1 Tax=Gamsiella multidivaricata TaxID=101098 RepID=UPI00221FBB73|nr:uncharacterized protein BC939DRAFT_252736 [Gamsiella multidivaricata]KAG0370654.1 hypothetical protein BGZ54_004970 [Gamsiella multidivaricata]KAI7819583.1 hypothetical protein BC939DRAFT_252736 [Gamsiella multidivaricata]
MTTPTKNEKHVQQFRARSACKTTNIPTQLDIKSGQRFVLWKSVLLIFKDAEYVMDGDDLVQFMMDENYEDLVPLRICHQLGVVLDVVTKSADKSAPAPLETSSPSQDIVGYISPVSEGSIDIAVELHGSTDLFITVKDITTRTLTVQSAERAVTTQQSLQEYFQLYQSYVEASTTGQPIQAASIKNTMEQRFGLLDTQLQSSDIFQVYTLQIQQQILNQLALLQNQVQAVRTQTYELSQYPIPRLFIVLPKPMRRRDKLSKPFTKQFRLFFLCECGKHTMTEGSTIPHEMHLAKHKGYDIDEPSESFERYGSHVLTTMRLLKYGYTIADAVVPPLALFNLADGIETVSKRLNVDTSSIAPLVDESIRHIESLQGNGGNPGVASSSMGLNAVEALEGADLRQLESFLRASDKGRDLGNLYQVVTAYGHVKWVCLDHYRSNYRESAMQHFRDVVKANSGHYFADCVNIEFGSSIVAKQFYEALVRPRGIQYLDLRLTWDVTFDELRALEAAISRSNITSLHVHLVEAKEPLLDVINRGRRYDPLIHLMANGRIQNMAIKTNNNVYQFISNSSFIMASHLRSLSITSESRSPKGPPRSILRVILKHCPSLQELGLATNDMHSTFEDFTSRTYEYPYLKNLTLH